MFLEISNLRAEIDGKQILNRLNLKVQVGEIHVIMGANGAGKSSLASALLGHPKFKITSGSINFNQLNITHSQTEQRARAGIFLAMQNPQAISGINVDELIRISQNALGLAMPIDEFYRKLHRYMQMLELDESYEDREFNVGFSGGEKKKLEMLQLLMLNPKLAILDEIDSGLDVDAVRTVAKAINEYHSDQNSLIIITHNLNLIERLPVTEVHILESGQIIRSGDKTLAETVIKQGFCNDRD